MAYLNGVYSAFAFLGFLCTTIPLPWHLQAWNTGTCLYMIWTALGCLNQFINSIVWNGNAINWAPVWCDISSKLAVGVSFALPACSLCINRRLFIIASVSSVTTTRNERLRGVFIDIAIGVGIPVYAMIIHYVNQGHRFDIYGDIGCFPHIYNTPVYYATMVSLSYILAVGSAVYCVLSIYTFNKRRIQFKELLASQSSNVTSTRYFRLMGLAGTELMLNIPLLIFATVGNVKIGVLPWISWEDTHFGFSRVDHIPALVWRARPLSEMSMELSRWTVVICALLFFGFFGFAEEARKNYRTAYETVGRRLGLNVTSKGSHGVSTKTGPMFSFHLNNSRRAPTPVHVTRETAYKRDTILSFTDLSISDPGGLLDPAHDSDVQTDAPIKRVSLPISTASYRASALTVPVVIYSPTSPEPFVICRTPEPAMPPGLGGEKALPPVPTDSMDYEEDDVPYTAMSSPSVYSVNTQPSCLPSRAPIRRGHDASDIV